MARGIIHRLTEQMTEQQTIFDLYEEQMKTKTELQAAMSQAQFDANKLKSELWLDYRQVNPQLTSDHMVQVNGAYARANEKLIAATLAYGLAYAEYQATYRRMMAATNQPNDINVSS